MKKRTRNGRKNIMMFLLSLMFLTIGSGAMLHTLDVHFEFEGGLARLWWIAPVIHTAVNLLPPLPVSAFGRGSLFADGAVVTLFARTIEEKLFPDNAFYVKSVNDNQFVQESSTGQTVKYGVSGANPAVEINRSTLPATITKRTDTSNDYDLDEFTTDPTLIQHTEALIVSYNKRASVLRNHVETLETKIADYFANLWLPDGAANIVETTGGTRPAGAPGATGARKKVTEEDIIRAAEIMDRMGVPHEGRYSCFPADMIADLRGVDNFKRQDAYGMSNIPSGVIARIHGIWVMSREYFGVYDNTGTPVKKALGAASAETDHLAALIWHEKFVNAAKGSVKAFVDEDKPEYYGSIFSFLARAGGKIRADKKGVVALVQDTYSG